MLVLDDGTSAVALPPSAFADDEQRAAFLQSVPVDQSPAGDLLPLVSGWWLLPLPGIDGWTAVWSWLPSMGVLPGRRPSPSSVGAAAVRLPARSALTLAACVDHARRRAPLWSDEQIGDILTDCGANVLLRSYLWSYPAGLDWFANLAADGGPSTVSNVLHAAYRRPLSPGDLTELWPAGPAIGRPGGSIHLQQTEGFVPFVAGGARWFS